MEHHDTNSLDLVKIDLDARRMRGEWLRSAIAGLRRRQR